MAENVKVPPLDEAPVTVVGSTPQSVFPFDFPFWDAADILPLVDGILLERSTFTVEGFFVQNGDPVEGGYGSGQVTLNAPVSNCTVTIDRFVRGSRESQFSRAAPLGMPSLNGDLNKLTARQQDVARRSLLSAPGSNGVSPEDVISAAELISTRLAVNGGNAPADAQPLRDNIGAESRNTPADYGAVDVTGALSSALAINLNLADRSNNQAALPRGELLVSATLIDDNSGESQFPPRSAKTFRGAGANETFVTSTVDGWCFVRTGGGFLDGGAQDTSIIGGFLLDGQSQAPIFNRNGLKIERTLISKIEDVHFINLRKPMEIIDAVGMTFERVNQGFCLDPISFAPGPGLLDPGNAGSPPNELVWIDSHATGNLNGVHHYSRSGNIVYVGSSFEGLGVIALSGQTQVADADSIRLVNPGFNAVVALNTFGTHFETNKGRSDIALIAGDRDTIINLWGTDFFQNGTQSVAQNILIDLTNSTAKVVVNLWGCGFNLVNGATSGVIFTVINPNNRVEGVDWEVNNYECIIQPGITHPGFTNEKYLSRASTTVRASGGGLLNTTVADRSRIVGKTVFRSVTITNTTSIGSPSGVLLVEGSGSPAKTPQFFFGATSSGTMVRISTFANSSDLQLAKAADGSFALGTGETLSFHMTYETP